MLQDTQQEAGQMGAREEVKEVGKTGRRRERGREKCSSCTLSFKGAKNFIP